MRVNSLYLLLFIFTISLPVDAYNDITITGDATIGGWDTDYPLTVQDDDPNIWTLENFSLKSGYLKFRADYSWDNNWGGDTFPSGTLVSYGNDIYVDVPGRYDITFDLNDNSYNIVYVGELKYKEGLLLTEYNALKDLVENIYSIQDAPGYNWFDPHTTIYGWSGLTLRDSVDEDGVNFSVVEGIEFIQSDLDGGGFMSSIGDLKHLKSLQLNFRGDVFLNDFDNLSALTQLKHLRLSGSYIDTSNLSFLYSFQNLETLDLSRCYIDFDAINLLNENGVLDNLQSFLFAKDANNRFWPDHELSGDNAAVTLSVSGYPEDEYLVKWFKNGEYLSGEDSTHYTYSVNENIGNVYYARIYQNSLPEYGIPTRESKERGASITLIIDGFPENTPQGYNISIIGKVGIDHENDVYFDYNEDSTLLIGYTNRIIGNNTLSISINNFTPFVEVDDMGIPVTKNLLLDTVADFGTIYLEDIYAWKNVPTTPTSTCETAIDILAGKNEILGTPNWYKYVAPFDEHLTIRYLDDTETIHQRAYIDIYSDCDETYRGGVYGFKEQTMEVSEGEILYFKINAAEYVAFELELEEKEIIRPSVTFNFDEIPANTPSLDQNTVYAIGSRDGVEFIEPLNINEDSTGYQLIFPEYTNEVSFKLHIENDELYRAVDSNGDEAFYLVNFFEEKHQTLEITDWNFIPRFDNSFENPEVIAEGSNIKAFGLTSWFSYQAQDDNIITIETFDNTYNKTLTIYKNGGYESQSFGADLKASLDVKNGDVLIFAWGYDNEPNSVIRPFGFNLEVKSYPTIVVQNLPENTPENTKVWATGDFDGWNHNFATKELIFNADSNYYEIKLPLTEDNPNFTFFLKGGSKFIELDQENEEVVRNILDTPYEPRVFVDDIYQWVAIPQAANTCETAWDVELGPQHVESTEQWYAFTAPSDGEYYIREKGVNVVNGHVMAEQVSIFANCNDDQSLASAKGALLYTLSQGETVYIKWEHYQGEDVAFDWWLELYDLSLLSEANGYHWLHPKLMTRTGENEYYVEEYFKEGSATFNLKDVSNAYIGYDQGSEKIAQGFYDNIPMEIETSGIYGLTVNIADGSYSYSFIKEYITPVSISPKYWSPDEEITVTIDLKQEGSIQNYEELYIWSWVDAVDTVYSAITNNDFNLSDVEAQMTKKERGVFEMTFIPTEFFNTTASEIKDHGFKFLVKDQMGYAQTADLGPFYSRDIPTVTVDFNLNMNVYITEQLFDIASDQVSVFASHDDGTDFLIMLSDTNNDGIYTFSLENVNIGDLEYTFRLYQDNDSIENNSSFDVSLEEGKDESFTHYFNNKSEANPEVILAVNMSRQVELDNFNKADHTVAVEVTIDEEKLTLPLEEDQDGNFSTTLFKLPSGETYLYKFITLDTDENTVLEESENRSFVIGTGQQTQLHWFNDELPEEKFNATWLVNVNPAILTGQFDPATGTVEILGSFNGWSEAISLTRVEETSVYTTSMDLPSTVIYYKLIVDGVEEEFIGQGQSDNRSHYLTSEDTTISVVHQFEETVKVDEEEIQVVTSDDGTVQVEVAIEAFEELEGEVTYQVMLADGSPLPDWVIFDPETLTFSIDPSKVPSGTRTNTSIEDLDIIVLASDEAGKSVAVEVTLPTESIISDATDEEDITSVEELFENPWKVYPTEVDASFSIENHTNVNYEYQVINLNGITLITGSTNQWKKEINISTLPRGMYVIKLNNGDQSNSFKVLKK
ncbi:T9SS type A sorting domain-containing protein [Flammeovirga sp. SubArs3]|uniref:T9SS type A sorting domain-containing protein n=1 Tax=Flammeovirga sp. SubArs3 TaxID=2995316 RepID=UPI00248AD179|nr:T9SS type A sorting domain-containing protein [Flammeovirga sp. SubArs3]